MNSGFSHEVFQLYDTGSEIPYVLRLRASRDELWDDDPLVPPRNGQDERRSVHHVAFHNSNAVTNGAWFPTPHYFYLTETNRVAPLTAGWRVKRALDITQVDRLPAAAPSNSTVYSSAMLLMFLEAASDGLEDLAWHSRWDLLTEALSASTAVGPLLDVLDEDHRAKVLGRFESATRSPPALAQNVLMKLQSARELDRIDATQVHRTLRCPFFRLNVSRQEVEQLLNLYAAIYSPEITLDTSDRSGRTLAELAEQFSWTTAHRALHDLVGLLSQQAISVKEHKYWQPAPIDLDKELASAPAVFQEHLDMPALEVVGVLVHLGQ